MTTLRESIKFLLNGEERQITDCPPAMTVLNWLRAHGLVGSKEGCAEGDCGACTVVIAELQANDKDAVVFKAINGCIRFMPTIDGKAIYTIEGLATENEGGLGQKLHPVQQAMVDHHGSQCGFCTPGFVMSLWGAYQNRQVQPTTEAKPTRAEVQICLNGNLCRCTGYRTIIEAGQAAYDLPPQIINTKQLAEKLTSLQDHAILYLPHPTSNFMAPKNLADLLSLRQNHPAATILAGGTDIGLWVTKQHKKLPEIIYLGEVVELQNITQSKDKILIGAAVSLSRAFAEIEKYYPDMRELALRFASTPICQSGTLVGNIANGSPIGDSMPFLIALKAEVILIGKERQRVLPLDQYYLDYRKTALAGDEIVAYLCLNLPQHSHQQKLRFATYKVARRYDSDISAVCGGFAVWLNADGVINEARLAYGGVAAIPKRAMRAERALIGKKFNESSIKAAMAELATEFAPLSDLRADKSYRQAMMQNLLWRFYLEKNPDTPLPRC